MLLILGAGGFAREVYSHCRDYGYHTMAFYDDVSDTDSIIVLDDKVKVYKSFDEVLLHKAAFEKLFTQEHPGNSYEFVIGVGDPGLKKALVTKALGAGLKPAETIIHPSVNIGRGKIGVGGIITPGCSLTVDFEIGDYVILNLNSTVGHDAYIGDYCTVNPGCSISGNVVIRSECLIGSCAFIREKKKIAYRVTVGAQACVTKDIDRCHTVWGGVPAKLIR